MTQLLINTTFVVDPLAQADFVAWARDMAVPAAAAAQGVEGVLLTRIIPPATQEDEEPPTYALQLRATPDTAHDWLHGPFRMLLEAFYAEHKRDHMMYFITMMEVIK